MISWIPRVRGRAACGSLKNRSAVPPSDSPQYLRLSFPAVFAAWRPEAWMSGDLETWRLACLLAGCQMEGIGEWSSTSSTLDAQGGRRIL